MTEIPLAVPCLLANRFHTIRNAGGETYLLADVLVGLPLLPLTPPADTSFSPQVVGLLLPNQTLASTIFWQVPQPPYLPLRVSLSVWNLSRDKECDWGLIATKLGQTLLRLDR